MRNYGHQAKRPGKSGELMIRRFYKGKRVVVTGHTGFKGSWLSLWLSDMGSKVIGVALKPDVNPNHYELIKLKDLLHKEYICDIRDFNLVQKIIQKEEPEIIFHLAAQPLVRDSYIIPKDTFDINIGGTVNLLEAIRKTNTIKSAVFITSDKCYENMEWFWGYRESDRLGGRDPYSASKGAMEIVCNSYFMSFFAKDAIGPHIGFSTVRAGNVIGGGDWARDRLIPDCVRALSEKNTIIIRNPNSTRPWQHVLEPLYGYLLLGMKLYKNPRKYSTPFNFGPFELEHITVEELVRMFIDIWGEGKYSIKREKAKMHEANLLRLVIDKAVNLLGWKPVLNSIEAIKWTASWYKSWNEKRKNLLDVSLRDIKNYEKLI